MAIDSLLGKPFDVRWISDAAGAAAMALAVGLTIGEAALFDLGEAYEFCILSITHTFCDIIWQR